MSAAKLAWVMGKQGSGKTTRICQVIQGQLPRWRAEAMLRLNFSPIQVHANRFNHMVVKDDGDIVFISGIHHDRVGISITELRGRHVIEFPHSGYIPASLKLRLDRLNIQARIFLIQLPEDIWKGVGGETGAITSPAYFMGQGRLLIPRATCNYQADMSRIRDDIARSGVPCQTFSEHQALIAAVRGFLLR